MEKKTYENNKINTDKIINHNKIVNKSNAKRNQKAKKQKMDWARRQTTAKPCELPRRKVEILFKIFSSQNNFPNIQPL